MAQWVEILGAGLGGSAITAVFNWLRNRETISFNRENKLWQEIGALKQQMAVMADEIKVLRKDRHDLRTQLGHEQLVGVALRMEINGLLKDLGKEPKYPIEEVMQEEQKQ